MFLVERKLQDAVAAFSSSLSFPSYWFVCANYFSTHIQYNTSAPGGHSFKLHLVLRLACFNWEEAANAFSMKSEFWRGLLLLKRWFFFFFQWIVARRKWKAQGCVICKFRLNSWRHAPRSTIVEGWIALPGRCLETRLLRQAIGCDAPGPHALITGRYTHPLPGTSCLH